MAEAKQFNWVSAKVPGAVFKTLTDAAQLAGTSLSQFIIQAALEKAEALLDPERTTVLSVADVTHMLDLVDHPRPPNPALIEAFERYKARNRNDHADHSAWRRPFGKVLHTMPDVGEDVDFDARNG